MAWKGACLAPVLRWSCAGHAHGACRVCAADVPACTGRNPLAGETREQCHAGAPEGSNATSPALPSDRFLRHATSSVRPARPPPSNDKKRQIAMRLHPRASSPRPRPGGDTSAAPVCAGKALRLATARATTIWLTKAPQRVLHRTSRDSVGCQFPANRASPLKSQGKPGRARNNAPRNRAIA